MSKFEKNIYMEVRTGYRVGYVKSVRATGFAISGKFTKDGKDYRPPTLEDLCKEHKWRHRANKYFRVPLPKNWIYCPRCHTEMLETLLNSSPKLKTISNYNTKPSQNDQEGTSKK